jgi:hypothetical protein
VPVLTYHAMNIGGNAYVDNDHVALATDLELLHQRGFAVRPLAEIVARFFDAPPAASDERWVGLAFDDGADFDARDIVHPTHGPQRSMLGVLRDFAARHPGAQPRLHATAFVIVSPEARRALDRTCMVGRGWWNDDWWDEALASGLIGIGNHSWDHNHDSLADARPIEAVRGTFRSIDTREKADYEVAQADEWLRTRAPNRAASLFAYPYGECNDYLVGTYFPERAARYAAAFTTQPGLIEASSDRWRLPRFTCGLDWKAPAQLAAILEGAR